MRKPLFLSFLFSLITSLNVAIAQDEMRFKGQDERQKQLTAEQMQKAKDYVHQGYLQNQYEAACGGKSNQQACAGEEATVFGDADAMVPAVSKMYSVFTATGPLGSMNFSNDGVAAAEGAASPGAAAEGGQAAAGNAPATGANAPAAPGAPAQTGAESAKAEDSGPSKYCDMLPVATEGGALAGQQLEQKQIDEGKAAPGTEQKESLFKVARSHEARSNTTIIQTTGFASTAACYVGTGPTGHSDPKVLLKTAAAVGLAGFYGMKTMAHLEYSGKTKSLAKKLPGQGACNPYSEPNCFCSEPTSVGAPEYAPTCISQPFRPRVAPGVIATSCINQNQAPDPSCECLKTQSCFDAQFVQFAGGINGGTAKLDDTLSGVSALSRGRLNRAEVESANLARLAKAKDYLNNAKLPAGLDPTDLSASQLKEANALAKLGVPFRYARIFSKFPARPDLAARFSGGIPSNFASYSPNQGSSFAAKSNAVYFEEANVRRPNNSRVTPYDSLNQAKAPASTANNETLTFAANAATNQADIHQNNDDVSLFKIISHRYQQSGIRSLSVNLME